jgi:hypothetical protein
MATDPVHYLVVPRVWAATLMLPLLIVFANAVGIAGGYVVSVILFGANPVTYLDNTFQYMDLEDLTSGLLKAAVFGMLVAAVGCLQGFYTTGGAEGVGRSTTRAVVVASITILISDFFPHQAAVPMTQPASPRSASAACARASAGRSCWTGSTWRWGRRVGGDHRRIGHGEERAPEAQSSASSSPTRARWRWTGSSRPSSGIARSPSSGASSGCPSRKGRSSTP